jgi:hypothetical protein
MTSWLASPAFVSEFQTQDTSTADMTTDLLTSVRDEIRQQFTAMRGDIAAFREETGGRLDVLHSSTASLEKHLRALRGDVRLIHNYLAQAVQTLDDYEVRLRRIEERLATKKSVHRWAVYPSAQGE